MTATTTATPTTPTTATAGTTERNSNNSVRHLLRLYRTELRLFAREPQVLVFVIGFPALTVLVLGGVFGTDADDLGFEYVNPSHFYAAAYFGVVLAAIGLIMLPARVASYRESGVIRRYETAGFARWVFPAVQYLCGLTFAAIGFASLLVTAQFGGDGVPSVDDLPSTLLGLAVGTLAFISLGVALGMLYPTSRAASGMGLAMFFPMFLLSGGGPPPESLTDGMQTIAEWLPLTHVIRATQEPWLALGDGQDHLLVCSGTLAVSTLVWLWRAGRVSRAS